VGAQVDTRIAGVILVDRDGRLLLQLRDGDTRIDPHRWCLPGGHVDPGEDPLESAHRELLEETGLKVDELSLFWQGLAPSAKFPGAVGEFSIFYAATAASDEAGVRCGVLDDRAPVPGLTAVPAAAGGQRLTHVARLVSYISARIAATS
jgi:8-oxo-dGTP pyrophosphatase MutT (NUDIX family)